MKKNRFFFLAGIFSCLSLLFISCGEQDELVYISYDVPDNLIPILTMNEESKYLNELIFDGLVNKTVLDKDGKEKYEWALVNPDGGYKEESPENRFLITISLRKGVRWHNGDEFTSKDVIHTFDAIKASDSPLKGWLFSFIQEYHALDIDNYTIKVELKVERSEEAFMELFAPIKIIPHRYKVGAQWANLPTNLSTGGKIVNDFKFKPIGTGPYKIVDRQSEGMQLSSDLSTSDHPNYVYFGNQPMIPKIRFMEEKDRIKAVKTLGDSPLGILFDVKPESFEALAQAKLEPKTYIPYGFSVIAFNTVKGPFRDLALRKAVNAATDKEVLAQALFQGIRYNPKEIINTSIFPTSSRYVIGAKDQFAEQSPFNQSKARQLINQSASRTFTLLVCSAIEGEKRTKQFTDQYVKMMQQVGLSVQIEDATAPVYNSKIKEGNFEAVLYAFQGFDHMYDIRALFMARAEQNIWQVQDPVLNNSLDQFGKTIAWERLLTLTQEIHTQIEELAPATFLFTSPRMSYHSNRIERLDIHPEVGFSTVENWIYIP